MMAVKATLSTHFVGPIGTNCRVSDDCSLARTGFPEGSFQNQILTDLGSSPLGSGRRLKRHYKYES
jgi:hypothetical protein